MKHRIVIPATTLETDEAWDVSPADEVLVNASLVVQGVAEEVTDDGVRQTVAVKVDSIDTSR